MYGFWSCCNFAVLLRFSLFHCVCYLSSLLLMSDIYVFNAVLFILSCILTLFEEGTIQGKVVSFC